MARPGGACLACRYTKGAFFSRFSPSSHPPRAPDEQSSEGRLGTPADIAETVAFLAGPGRWVNGQVIYANGGMRAQNRDGKTV